MNSAEFPQLECGAVTMAGRAAPEPGPALTARSVSAALALPTAGGDVLGSPRRWLSLGSHCVNQSWGGKKINK